MVVLETVACENVMGHDKKRMPYLYTLLREKFFKTSYASLTNPSTLLASSRPFYFPFLNDFPTFDFPLDLGRQHVKKLLS